MGLFKVLQNNVVKHPFIMTGFDSSTRTELTGSDADEKADMLTYINKEERDKLVTILKVFAHIDVADSHLVIAEDIYEEGVLIRYLSHSYQRSGQPIHNKTSDNGLAVLDNSTQINIIKNSTDSQLVFVPFRFRQFDAYRRLFYLAIEAQIRVGNLDIVSATENKQQVIVTATDYITPNMVRIYIQSNQPLPANDPGFAYRFALAMPSNHKLSLKQFLHKTWQAAEPKVHRLPFTTKVIHSIKKYGYLAGLELLKRRQVKRPNKIQSVGIVEKRYYTLRQLGSAEESLEKQLEHRFSGEVDVYIHDDTPGSLWAKSLKAGDEIYIDHHYHETIKHMTVGQSLLICDETSMPSVAAVLERWQETTCPVVIQITNHDTERSYFDEVVLPPPLKNKLTIHHVNAHKSQDVAQSVIDIIEEQQVTIDCAWGAIGSKDYRAIKKYLKQVHGLKGKCNRVRAYWVAE